MSIQAASRYNATDVEKVESIKITERGNYYYVKWRNLEDRLMNSWVEEPFLLGSEALTRFHEKSGSEASEEPLFVRQPSNKAKMESQSDSGEDSDELDNIPLFQRARLRKRKHTISSSPETSTSSTTVISPLMSYSVTDESFLLLAGDKRKSKVSKSSSKSDVHDKLTSSTMDKTRVKTPELIPASETVGRSNVSLPTMADIDRPTPPATPDITTSLKQNMEKPKASTIADKPPVQKDNETASKDTQEITPNNNPHVAFESTPSEPKSKLPSQKLALGERYSEKNRSQNFAEISKKFDSLLDLISHNVHSRNAKKSQGSTRRQHRRSQTSSDATMLSDRGATKETSAFNASQHGNNHQLGRLRSSSEIKIPAIKLPESHSAPPPVTAARPVMSSDGSSSQFEKVKARQSLKSIPSLPPPPPPPPPPPSTLWRGDIQWGEHKMLDMTIQPVRATVSLDAVRSALKERSSIEIKSFFSQQHLIQYLTAPPTLLSLSFPADAVRYGKLRNFLTINNAAALIPIALECSFAVVPYCFPLVAAATDSSNPSLKQALFLVYIKLPKPSASINNDGMDSKMSVNFSSCEAYGWNMVTELYAVPKQVADMPKDKSLYIFSDHPDASKVQQAAQAYGYKIATKPSDLSIYAVLIHNEPFPNAMIPELLDFKRPGVHFFLYGYSGCETSTRVDQEIFPEHSGGLITMDAMDLVQQPDVLEQMIQNVEKLNAQIRSSLQPRWQIVFREDIFRDIEKRGQISEYKDRADMARWQVIKALDDDLVSIMEQRIESHDSTSQWFDRVSKAFATTRRFFVQVVLDKPNEASHRLNMVKPQELLNVFKQ